MGNDATSARGVQSVDRALSILALLAQRGESGISELADALDVHRSTAFRLLATLEAHGMVTQDVERGRYRLGLGVVRLAGAATVRLDVVSQARPVCARLAAEVGETVNVAILGECEALYVDQATGPSTLALHNWVGQRIPLHATSNGKVLLAHADRAVRDRLLRRRLPAFTDHTVTDRATLSAQLEQVRERGFAVAVDELELGLTAVAAPVRSIDGTVVASLSASGPTFRLPPDRVREVAASVVAAAAEVSGRLGWSGPHVPDRGLPVA
jgi:DNA-binding IclR family transcriptional regulator